MSKQVDKLITAVEGEWKFDKQVSESFDSHIRKSVPCYDSLQKMVCDISEWFINDNSFIYDLGSATGETLSNLYQKHSNKKNIEFIGIEQSKSMVELAKTKHSEKNIKFIESDLIKMKSFDNADFIVSIYTLQFLSVKNRYSVIKKIYESLNYGGAFIFTEKVKANSSLSEDMYNQLHWDFKNQQGLTDEMILQKARSLRGVLTSLTINENMQMLKKTGFTMIETFFKWNNFAGILAVKSLEKRNRLLKFF
ncbi:MAG: methyltransferase domain-containing protein [Prolixibacteraceae bacterium]|nr:methyltransferase domain-containing protein [Prolixibacteraceae bacterium]